MSDFVGPRKSDPEDHQASNATTAVKGARNGVCYRTACSNSRAVHFNRHTRKYYCPQCARRLNTVLQADGLPLCTGVAR